MILPYKLQWNHHNHPSLLSPLLSLIHMHTTTAPQMSSAIASWLADTVLVDRTGALVPLSKVFGCDLIAVSFSVQDSVTL